MFHHFFLSSPSYALFLLHNFPQKNKKQHKHGKNFTNPTDWPSLFRDECDDLHFSGATVRDSWLRSPRVLLRFEDQVGSSSRSSVVVGVVVGGRNHYKTEGGNSWGLRLYVFISFTIFFQPKKIALSMGWGVLFYWNLTPYLERLFWLEKIVKKLWEWYGKFGKVFGKCLLRNWNL